MISYTQNGTLDIPEVEIKKDNHEYVYVPLRGYSSVLAVMDLSDKCIGYILSETLGYESVKAWMTGAKWVDGGY